MTVSMNNDGKEHDWKKWQERRGLCGTTWHDVGRARGVRKPNVPRSVRRALGNRPAICKSGGDHAL